MDELIQAPDGKVFVVDSFTTQYAVCMCMMRLSTEMLDRLERLEWGLMAARLRDAEDEISMVLRVNHEFNRVLKYEGIITTN